MKVECTEASIYFAVLLPQALSQGRQEAKERKKTFRSGIYSNTLATALNVEASSRLTGSALRLSPTAGLSELSTGSQRETRVGPNRSR